MSANNKRRKTQSAAHNKKSDVNRLLVSFLLAWKVKSHLIYVPRCQNRLLGNTYLKILLQTDAWQKHTFAHTHTHTGPFSWMVTCRYSLSGQKGIQSFSEECSPWSVWWVLTHLPDHQSSSINRRTLIVIQQTVLFFFFSTWGKNRWCCCRRGFQHCSNTFFFFYLQKLDFWSSCCRAQSDTECSVISET